jgi:hypothetical protein
MQTEFQFKDILGKDAPPLTDREIDMIHRCMRVCTLTKSGQLMRNNKNVPHTRYELVECEIPCGHLSHDLKTYWVQEGSDEHEFPTIEYEEVEFTSLHSYAAPCMSWVTHQDMFRILPQKYRDLMQLGYPIFFMNQAVHPPIEAPTAGYNVFDKRILVNRDRDMCHARRSVMLVPMARETRFSMQKEVIIRRLAHLKHSIEKAERLLKTPIISKQEDMEDIERFLNGVLTATVCPECKKEKPLVAEPIAALPEPPQPAFEAPKALEDGDSNTEPEAKRVKLTDEE